MSFERWIFEVLKKKQQVQEVSFPTTVTEQIVMNSNQQMEALTIIMQNMSLYEGTKKQTIRPKQKQSLQLFLQGYMSNDTKLFCNTQEQTDWLFDQVVQFYGLKTQYDNFSTSFDLIFTEDEIQFIYYQLNNKYPSKIKQNFQSHEEMQSYIKTFLFSIIK